MASASTPWRFGRRFSASEVTAEMLRWADRRVTSPGDQEPADGTAWNRYYSQATIAEEPPGPVQAGGPFERARALVVNYDFSDPRIVRGHFDASVPLLGRTMLLEISAFGLRYLCGVRVADVRDASAGGRTVFAFRYDTLEGHIEQGAEWFVLTKHHQSGDVAFRIEAAWRPGSFPNWWSRIGFSCVGPRVQRAWHRLAYLRLRKLLASRGLPRVPRGRGLVHPGLPVEAPPISLVGAGSPPGDLHERELEEAR